jgi:hypothetical protein
MSQIATIFLPAIDLADSDAFMLADGIYILTGILIQLLEFKPSDEFMDAHNELCFSLLDYLVGNKRLRRYNGRGKPIRSRCDEYSVIGYWLDFEGRDFSFEIIRQALDVALKNSVISVAQHLQVINVNELFQIYFRSKISSTILQKSGQ